MAENRGVSSNNLYGHEGVFGSRSDAIRRIRRAIGLLAFITVIGTLGYIILEGWSIIDALYMTVITVYTIGFGEVNTLDTTGRIWTMALIISGVGALGYATTSVVALAIEGTVRGYFRERRMRAEIDKLNAHYVLCGFGRVGHQVAHEFAIDNIPFVVIEQDPVKVEDCLERGYRVVLGEASDDAVLEEASIRRARGLVAAVDSDADNVFVVLSARKINPDLHIVARASSDESAAKLEIAGADRTLSPYAVGGRRLASLATQPLIVDFLDVVTRGEKGIEFRLEEFGVPKESPLANHTI
jgi:voltage-gated potassium channel